VSPSVACWLSGRCSVRTRTGSLEVGFGRLLSPCLSGCLVGGAVESSGLPQPCGWSPIFHRSHITCWVRECLRQGVSGGHLPRAPPLPASNHYLLPSSHVRKWVSLILAETGLSSLRGIPIGGRTIAYSAAIFGSLPSASSAAPAFASCRSQLPVRFLVFCIAGVAVCSQRRRGLA
jgi:hypothetical protein